MQTMSVGSIIYSLHNYAAAAALGNVGILKQPWTKCSTTNQSTTPYQGEATDTTFRNVCGISAWREPSPPRLAVSAITNRANNLDCRAQLVLNKAFCIRESRCPSLGLRDHPNKKYHCCLVFWSAL